MKILKYQFFHLLFLLSVIPLIVFYTENNPGVFSGEFAGIETRIWFVVAILSPIIHQFYVLICWRSELHYKSLSKIFGKNAFKIYKAGFGILILSRLITVTILALSNSRTLNIDNTTSYIGSLILAIPSVYLFYSVAKYFGIDRAYGYDHFYPERAKEFSFVRKGIFKYTSNGMYVFGFFILWIPAILLKSEAALIIAFFNHIYIWIHYYFTELPDIKFIYGNKSDN